MFVKPLKDDFNKVQPGFYESLEAFLTQVSKIEPVTLYITLPDVPVDELMRRINQRAREGEELISK